MDIKNTINFSGFTGIDQEYQKPTKPDLSVRTTDVTVEESMLQVVKLLEDNVGNCSIIKYNLVE